MYVVIFKFNLIKSTLRIRLGLGLKVFVMGLLMMHITWFLLLIIYYAWC